MSAFGWHIQTTEDAAAMRAEIAQLQADLGKFRHHARAGFYRQRQDQLEITRLTAERDRAQDRIAAMAAEMEGPMAWISTNRISGEALLGTSKVTSEYDDTLYSHTPLYAAPMPPSVPEILFDGMVVFAALDDRAKHRTSAENVSDVLDAVVRVLRAAPKPEDAA